MLTLLGAGQGQNSSFDADYQAVLNYATTQGYTLPSDLQKTLQNQLLVDLKAAGIWSKLDTFANFATDGDSNFALIDWKRLSQYTAVNSPTFTANQGFKGNGTSSYINTNFNPFIDGVQYQLNNASRYAWVYDASGSSVDGVLGFNANRLSFSNVSQNINNGTSGGAIGVLSGTGMKSIHRPTSNSIEVYQDTTLSLSSSTTSTSIIDSNQLVLLANSAYGQHTISTYAMGASLVSENTDFYNIYKNYFVSL